MTHQKNPSSKTEEFISKGDPFFPARMMQKADAGNSSHIEKAFSQSWSDIEKLIDEQISRARGHGSHATVR